LHSGLGSRLERELETASELVRMTRHVADEWQSHIDLLIEPKGLRLGLAKGSVMVIPRDGVYPGMLLFGNPLNLAARLQAAADPDQLVCSNAAYREIERADLKNRFKPYHCESTKGLLDAKNFGPLKAWTLSLSDKRLIQRRLAGRDAEFRNRRNRKNAAK
jgi:class 3 adenylate cyclase